jgi:DNA end-binding protein Ku
MRAMWTGSLSFGLVNVPVKMYTATENHSVSFHQVHAADGGRIRMKRTCSVCGEEVAYAQIAKGYETADGRRVVLRSEEFADLPRAPKKEIEVLQFVPAEQVDPILFDKTYYLEPDGRALKPYVLLRTALLQTERTAVVKVALRERTQLGCLRIHDDVLVLQTMLWPDEIREPDFGFLDEDVDIRGQELQMALSLITNLSADFEPGDYTDEYREAVLALIEDKLAGGESVTVAADESAPGGAGAVVDLMAALRASVARTGGGAAAEATDSSDESARATEPAPRRRPAAKRASGPAAKKSTATRRAAPAKKAAPAAATTARAAAKAAPATRKATATKSTATKSTKTAEVPGQRRTAANAARGRAGAEPG